MKITSDKLRTMFLNFFKKHGHEVVASSPLIPMDDPTLLFTNAGMVQFKNVFTQKETRPYKKACSSQKCVRAGGKHNDLENVGQTARHHTFFEMLGNFSFGDYFKEEAIKRAFEFLTKEVGLEKERLVVSVFEGDDAVPADEESYKIWRDIIGIDEKKILRLGRSDNFWQMGDTGPCGPCTEIYYDRKNIKAGFGSQGDDAQIVEIWNLVFMQYERFDDGTLKKLPAPCVDTGMGLERLTCVTNDLASNYETDLFVPLIEKIQSISNKKYSFSDSLDDMSMRVIADHSRATAFLMADGLSPSNEGRGYVLRRIMRRAIRFGAKIGLEKPFFHEVCSKVCDVMSSVYPELSAARSLIERQTLQEEETFRKTLSKGIELFHNATAHLQSKGTLSGSTVFKLYETYGFPPDLTEDLANEKSLQIDWKTFEEEKKAHEEKSAGSLGIKVNDEIFLQLKEKYGTTSFFEDKEEIDVKIIALIKDGKAVESIGLDDECFALFNQTNFYGESGGQVGDLGTIISKDFEAKVTDTQKINGVNVHRIKVVKGQVKIGQTATAKIDYQRRQAIKRNHSATHLLHSALRTVLGSHVTQKGSLVEPNRLRFDFSHFASLTQAELDKVEHLVNSWILANEEAKVSIMPIHEAKNSGALALFGEKYEDNVRVLKMGTHSTELCGGTHCHRTGDIGGFVITSESPLAQGVRRIEAITGFETINFYHQSEKILKDLVNIFGVNKESLQQRSLQLVEEIKKHQKESQKINADNLKNKAHLIADKAEKIFGYNFVSQLVDFTNDSKELLSYADFIRDKIKSGIVLLGVKSDEDKCLILLALSKDLVGKLHAGNVIAKIAPIIGGKGGGRPDIAQAGGKETKLLAKALEEGKNIIEEFLKQ